MRMLSIIGALTLALFPASPAHADDIGVIITEIGAHEIAQLEWIEVYNAGTVPIDLAGWRFWEDAVKHKLAVARGSFVIASGEYLIIANDAVAFMEKHVGYEGTVLDSSWSSLKESGEEIGLIDAGGIFIEQFTYPAFKNTSLQRIASIYDYTVSNWSPHPTSDSAGRVNEFSQQPSLPTTYENPTPLTDPSVEPIITALPVASALAVQPQSVLINEICSDPASGPEWIELININSTPLDLTGWTITEGAGAVTKLSGTIDAIMGIPYLVIDAMKGALNNAGDIIILRDARENIIDQVAYGSWDDGNITDNLPTPKQPTCLARDPDTLAFALTQTLTPHAKNSITTTGGTKATTVTTTTGDKSVIAHAWTVRISEVFPNPVGSDLDTEYIELHNFGTDLIDIGGWSLADTDRVIYYFLPGTTLYPGGYYFFERGKTRIALDNDGDTIRLYDVSEALVDTFVYSGEITEGVTVNRVDVKRTVPSGIPTPGQENIARQVPVPPVAKATCTSDKLSIICDASDSYDLNGDKLSFVWMISGVTIEGSVVTHAFEAAGVKHVMLLVSDGVHESRARFSVTTVNDNEIVEKFSSTNEVVVEPMSPIEIVSIGSVTESWVGRTIAVEGRITKTTLTTATIADGTGALSVSTSKVDVAPQVGDVVRVTGAIRLYRGNPQIVPLHATAITKVEPPPREVPVAATISVAHAASSIPVEQIPPRSDKSHALAYLGTALVASLGSYGVSRSLRRRASAPSSHAINQHHRSQSAISGKFNALSNGSPPS